MNWYDKGKPVEPSGEPTADLWFIGEAPGGEEEYQGKVFVGRAGKMFDSLLRNAGIFREKVYIDNLVPVRPPSNDFDFLYDGKKPNDILLACRKALEEKILQYKPKVVVLLGKEAMKALLPMSSITKYRGSIYQYNDDTRLIPTYHPSFVMRQSSWYYVARHDFIRAKWESRHPDVPLPQPTIIDRPTIQNVRDCIEACMKSSLTAFDIETTDVVECIGLSWARDIGVSVPLAESYWGNDLPEVLDLLRGFLASDRPKAAHNSTFDLSWLRYKLGWEVKFDPESIDTMFAHHFLYPVWPKSLGFIVSLYTRYPYHKDLSEADPARYNALDAITTKICGDELRKLLAREGLYDSYMEVVHSIIDPVTQINSLGLKVNEEERSKVCEAHAKKLKEYRQTLRRIIGNDEYNPASSKQTQEALYKTLKFPTQYHRKTGKVTTSWKEVQATLFRKAKTKEQKEFLTTLKNYKSTQNILSNWLRYDIKKGKLKPLENGRLTTSINIAGTISGRPSSSKGDKDAEDKISKEGTNLLNVPHGPCRHMVVPDSEELIFVAADLEQAEAKVVAYEADCEYIIEAFESGKNIHIVNAEIVFPGQKIKKSSDPNSPYQRSKKVVHMLNYGGTPYAMAPVLGIPRGTCQEYIDRYFARCPEIRNNQNRIWNKVLKTRELKTFYGRRLQFLSAISPHDNQLKRTALSFIPQSTVGDKTNVAMATIWKQIELPERICLSHYDALILQVKRKNVDKWRQLLIDVYSSPIKSTTTGREYTIGVDVTIGETWDDV